MENIIEKLMEKMLDGVLENRMKENSLPDIDSDSALPEVLREQLIGEYEVSPFRPAEINIHTIQGDLDRFVNGLANKSSVTRYSTKADDLLGHIKIM